MSKAIMIFDEMPNNCIECVACRRGEDIPLGNYTYEKTFRCNFIRYDNEKIDGYIRDIFDARPDWCPLKVYQEN